MDPGTGILLANGTNGYLNGLVLKLDPNGDYLNHILFSGVNSVHLYDIKYSRSGYIYCTGGLDFVSTLFFSNSIENLSTDGSKDGLLIKMNLDLEKVWLKQYTGNGDQFAVMMALSDQEDIYISGTFQGTVDFDPGSGNSSAVITGAGQSRDGFIVELDSSGSFNWIYQIPTDSTLEFWDLEVSPATGDLISHGVFDGAASFDFFTTTDTATNTGNRFILGIRPQFGYFQHRILEGFPSFYPLSLQALSDSSLIVFGSAWGVKDFEYGINSQINGCDTNR